MKNLIRKTTESRNRARV